MGSIKNNYSFIFIYFSFFVLSFLFLLTPVICEARTYGSLTVHEVNSVYDGDTFRAEINGVHSIIGDNIRIRLHGIDAPEMDSGSPFLRERAVEARDFLARKLAAAEQVVLKNIRRGNYFRIVADVYVDEENLSDLLLERGLAEPYIYRD